MILRETRCWQERVCVEKGYAFIRLSDVGRLVVVSGSRCELSCRFGLYEEALGYRGLVGRCIISLTTSVGVRGGKVPCEVDMV